MATTTLLSNVTTQAPGHGHEKCTEWQDAQHLQWQVANMCFAVAFLLPNHLRYHLLILRTAIALGSLLLATWGGLIVCHPDVPVWYSIFFVINVCHVCYLLYTMYPFRFTAELRNIWTKMFQPLRVSRYQFTKLAGRGNIQTVQKGTNYVTEGVTTSGKTVAILLSGRLKAMHEGTFLHYVEPSSFVDSPEFEAATMADNMDTDHQVTVTAVEESRLLVWNRTALDKFLKKEAFLQAVIHNLIGKDITSKLYQVQDLLMTKDQEPGSDSPDEKRTPKSVVGIRNRIRESLSSTTNLARQDSIGSKDNISNTSSVIATWH